ncbi:sterol desaturase family protein [Daejeonella rubra]|nr:sterol desaturase family protein [Daejeonella rubra]
MDSLKIKNKGQARIFKNDQMESLTKTKPWIIYSIYIPVCSAMIYYGSKLPEFSLVFIAVLFLIAMISWTLFEYLAHRYLFHLNPGSQWGKRLVYIFHGNHHEFPRDTERLFMPPVPSILIGSIVFGIFAGISYLLTGTINYSFIFFPGFITGYLIYVSMHYAIHTFAPPKIFKGLWRNHHLHHYRYHDKGYGVSTPFWDIMFNTVPKNGKL